MSDRPRRNIRPPRQIYVPDENINFTDDFSDGEENDQPMVEDDEISISSSSLNDIMDEMEEEEDDYDSEYEGLPEGEDGYRLDGFVVNDDDIDSDEEYEEEEDEEEWCSSDEETGDDEIETIEINDSLDENEISQILELINENEKDT